ncbi:histidine phosphatase family protein [Nocardia sp. NPDC059240]|uniref:histidine phosphatase family protein n=1 Tax=Nocardia sp. NPDC059240 TaxID=3346786 RepID=UPI00369745D2
MSAVTRLTLITHAITDAVQAARFPADEPLNPLGERSVAAAGGLPALDPTLILCAPELRTSQTAKALGLSATPEPALRDLNCGTWSGKSMDDITPDHLMSWLTDPTHNSHNGESLTALLTRVRTWLDTLAGSGDRILAITHPAVVRAAILTTLTAPPESFWRIDIPPLTATTLHHRAPTWTLRTTAHALTP